MSIKVEGEDNLIKVIDNILDINRLADNVGKACAIVERSAKEKTPVGSGELRRSITSRVNPSFEIVCGEVYTNVEYAPYVEFGTGLFAESEGRKDVPWSYKDDEGNWHSTSGMAPHPYLRPALNEAREEVVDILKEGLLGNDR